MQYAAVPRRQAGWQNNDAPNSKVQQLYHFSSGGFDKLSHWAVASLQSDTIETPIICYCNTSSVG
jgi:hypothetical protein